MLIRKGVALLGILGGSMALAQNILHQPVNPTGVTQVHTAIDHISILELPAKITRVAAGSSMVQIEWHGNCVFIKPLKAGQSTNLMVWTEHGLSSYELDAPGDVANMSFVIDETTSPVSPAVAPAGTPVAKPSPQEVQRRADSLIGSTLLDAMPVSAHGVHAAKDHVSVSIQQVVRSKDSLYVRFSIMNPDSHPYRIVLPAVFTMAQAPNADVPPTMRNVQIPQSSIHQLETGSISQVPIRGTALPEKDVAPGSTVEGVLVLEPTDVQKPRVYKFVFGNDGNQRVEAAAVL